MSLETIKLKIKFLPKILFENCQTKLKQTNKNVSFEKNTKSVILKIGNQNRNHYFLIYEEKNSLNFEYERNRRFLVGIKCYFDWLVIKLRPIRKQKFLPSSLKLHYLQTIDFPHTIARKNLLPYSNFWFMLKN
jgi:hypothetical protein